MSDPTQKTQKSLKLDRRYVWMGLGLLSLFINSILKSNPYFTEVVYSRGIFLLFRWIWDYTLGLIPIPLLYIIGPLLIFYLIRSWRKGRPHRQERPFINRIGSLLISILGLLGAAVFLFYFMWGFNYARLPVSQQLKLTITELTDEEVENEYKRVTKLLLAAKKDLGLISNDFFNQALIANKPEWKDELEEAFADSSGISYRDFQIAHQEEFHELYKNDFFLDISDSLNAHLYNFKDLQNEIREELTATLVQYNYPIPGRPKSILLYPKGFLLQLGAKGIYIPYVGQGHVDAGITKVSIPSTMAHEMAHAYGFGDEGLCNFWAYLACTKSESPLIRYSGYFNYWRHVANLYARRDPQGFKMAYKKIPLSILIDLNANRNVNIKYPGFFPKFSQEFYEGYLKYQGIEEGRKSYSMVVSYVVAQTKKQANTPQ
ncbi:MAG: DUF3810 family protein [Bacteroidota bacterium]